MKVAFRDAACIGEKRNFATRARIAHWPFAKKGKGSTYVRMYCVFVCMHLRTLPYVRKISHACSRDGLITLRIIYKIFSLCHVSTNILAGHFVRNFARIGKNKVHKCCMSHHSITDYVVGKHILTYFSLGQCACFGHVVFSATCPRAIQCLLISSVPAGLIPDVIVPRFSKGEPSPSTRRDRKREREREEKRERESLCLCF